MTAAIRQPFDTSIDARTHHHEQPLLIRLSRAYAQKGSHQLKFDKKVLRNHGASYAFFFGTFTILLVIFGMARLISRRQPPHTIRL